MYDEWLVIMFKVCLKGRRVPMELNVACIISLHKTKGDSKDCGNNRIIILLSVMEKMYA